MVRSLRLWDPAATIRILALDAPAARIARDVFPPAVTITTLDEIQCAVPATRTRWEYYATYKPAFLLRALRAESRILFVDADTWFFSSPEPLWEELANASIGLSPHRFPASKSDLLQYGLFNAGCVYYRSGEEALRCAADWLADCLDWCGETPQPDGRFMNQGYLNRWPERYGGVHIIQHPGANLAPWNIAGHAVEHRNRSVTVDGRPLVFYHFSQTHRDAGGNWYSLEVDLDNIAIANIYARYAAEVEDELRHLARVYGVTGAGSVRNVRIPPGALRVYAGAI
jgi:hypothetical protein